MTFRLNNSIIRNSAGKVKFKKFRPDGYEHYHIGVWLEADSEREMDQVTHVEYMLHPTFKRRFLKSRNRENDFSVTFWSWGTFEIIAKVHLVQGSEEEVVEISHLLRYDLPADTGDNYVDVT